VIAAFVLIFTAPRSTAAASWDSDAADNIWASELAPLVDYGIYGERLNTIRIRPEPRGFSPMQTPPPEAEEELGDPKPHKPPEGIPVPVDPSHLELPLA